MFALRIGPLAAVAALLPSGALSPRQAELVEAARRLPHLEAQGLLHDADDVLPSDVRELVDGAPLAVLRRLLEHEEGRVRALAVAGLYEELGPHALPLLRPLADDEGPAPPRRVPVAMLTAAPLPTEPQTVGAIARSLVEHHLERAGYRGGIEGRYGQPGFAAYWEERRGREHCLSWWSIALSRASQSTCPTPSGRRDEIAALRADIDRLPEIERAWVLLALCAPWETGAAEPGARELASDEDLVRAARDLAARGLLLALLRGEPLGSSDPDLRLAPPTAFPYERVAPFVLRHARELLAPETADELLALESLHLAGERVGGAPPCITSAWSIAAADLRPRQARLVLHRALDLYSRGTGTREQDHRCFLAQALWRHGGEIEIPTLVDWFFGEEPRRGAFGFGRHRFADWLADPERGAILRAILSDPRTSALDWQTLRRLGEAANRSAGADVVAAAELRGLAHPMGEGHYHWSSAEERARHPERTALLEDTLERWRRQLADWASRADRRAER